MFPFTHDFCKFTFLWVSNKWTNERCFKAHRQLRSNWAHLHSKRLMRSGSNIHVQQHQANMINEEWKRTQNDAPFVAFYNMRAVTFVLPGEMADVSIAGLQWFILMPRLCNIIHV